MGRVYTARGFGVSVASKMITMVSKNTTKTEDKWLRKEGREHIHLAFFEPKSRNIIRVKSDTTPYDSHRSPPLLKAG
jgi:hypothetical protein